MKNKKTNFQVSVRTSDFRGDHSADIEVGLDVPNETTVGELVKKVFWTTDVRKFFDTDVICIRVAHPLKPIPESIYFMP